MFVFAHWHAQNSRIFSLKMVRSECTKTPNRTQWGTSLTRYVPKEVHARYVPQNPMSTDCNCLCTCTGAQLLMHSVIRLRVMRYSLVVRVAVSGLVQCEELAQLPEAEVPLHILLVVDDARTQRLLVCLALQNLLLYRPRLKAKDIESESWNGEGFKGKSRL